MTEEKKRVLLIGERLGMDLFAMLGDAGCQVAPLESLIKREIFTPLYKPHVISLPSLSERHNYIGTVFGKQSFTADSL
jgi:hypothetical protein